MKFKPRIDDQKGKKKVLFARVDMETYDKVKAIAKKYRIRISDLYRQMIYFSIENMED